MAEYSNKLSLIVVGIALSLTITIFSQAGYMPMVAIAQEENGELDIPTATCIYEDHEYSLTPHIFNDGQESTRIAFPNLPDNYEPEMTLEEGSELTMQFDGDKQPTEIQALLVDYDADVTETYPLEKIDDNKFAVTQTGIKTLEVIGTFPDNEHISYTMLVDVIDSTENSSQEEEY